MNKRSRLNKYVELFSRYIQEYLAAPISIKTTIYPVNGDGAVFEFVFNIQNQKDIKFEKTYPSVGSVLSSIPQKFVSGITDRVRFGGTNIYMEDNRLLLIKGEDDPKKWSGESIKDDVLRVVSTAQGGVHEH